MNSGTHESKILLHLFLRVTSRADMFACLSGEYRKGWMFTSSLRFNEPKTVKGMDSQVIILNWRKTLSESLILAQDERWRHA